MEAILGFGVLFFSVYRIYRIYRISTEQSRRKGGGGLLPPFDERDHHAYNVLRHKPENQLTPEERQQLDEMWRKVD